MSSEKPDIYVSNLIVEALGEADAKLEWHNADAPLLPVVVGVEALDGLSALVVLGPLQAVVPAAEHVLRAEELLVVGQALLTSVQVPLPHLDIRTSEYDMSTAGWYHTAQRSVHTQREYKVFQRCINSEIQVKKKKKIKVKI